MDKKKIMLGIRLLFICMHARVIMLFHYKSSLYKSGKWFQGGRYGKFTSSGWEWVVRDYYACKRERINQDVPWPVSSQIRVVMPENITFHPDDLNNFQTFGNYFQARGKITIGRGTYIAPNVGLITANHNFNDLDSHLEPKEIILGEHCWIGMNSVILPGVILGDHTVVGAGSVVTHSFPEGNCVIVGSPARKIRDLEISDKDSTL